MDLRLKKIKDDTEWNAFRDVRDVHAQMAAKGQPQKVIDAIPEVPKLLQACQKIAAELKKRFPLDGNDARPGWLRDHILHIHRDYIGPLGGKTTLAARMEERVRLIQDLKPEDVRHWVLDVFARIEIERCESLLAELEWLRAFPERIAQVVREIEEWLDSPYGGARHDSTPTPAPQFAPAPSRVDPDEGKQYDQFDPRT